MSSAEAVVIPETVLIVNDRLKHGQNVVKILESQMDTAQQNIILLQGQVRLASETISNLKKHFSETENLLTKLLEAQEVHTYRAVSSEVHKTLVKSDRVSPLLQHSGGSSVKSFDGKPDNSRSPYAQQLRQVLDVLQDKELPKTYIIKAEEECGSLDCQTTPRHFECNSTCTSIHHNTHHNKRNDYCKSKQEMRRNDSSHDASIKSSHVLHATHPPNHCTGSCCSKSEIPVFKGSEKSSPAHYVGSHSPAHVSQKHKHRPAHCGEKCQCHGFLNYVPYGYHVIESAPGIPESIQRTSPSARRKRSYVPNVTVKNPSHSKYTTVKRIERSKLTAQKMLQDFAKRQFYAYNPRYDLDLLIVSPPMPALDFIQNNKRIVEKIKQPVKNIEEYVTESLYHVTKSHPLETEELNGLDTLNRHDVNNANDDNISGTSICIDTVNSTSTNCATELTGDDTYDITNTTFDSLNNEINNSYGHSLFEAQNGNVPTVEEENITGEKNLENHIMVRHDPPDPLGRNVAMANH